MLKVLRIVISAIRWIITVFLVMLLAIVATQRVSNNKASIAGFRVFTVITESMVPKYNIGDAICTVYVDPSEIKVGDDVTYIGEQDSFKDKIITHRVINIEKGENDLYIFETQGIANDEPDPKINQTQIYGKVIYKIKTISYLNGIIGNLYGMYFAIFIPMGIILFLDFAVLRKDKEELEEYEDLKGDVDEKKEKRKQRRSKRRNKRKK